MRILVIEDEKKTAAFLTKGLREAGFRVEVAHDGEAGLAAARRSKLDLFVVERGKKENRSAYTFITELFHQGPAAFRKHNVASVLGLTNVSDGTNTGNVSVPMAVLLADTTADRFVDSAGISQTKSQSGKPVTGSNFREDLNVDGFLDSADISLVKSKSDTALA